MPGVNLTMDEVVAVLDSDEPNDAEVAQLGRSAIPHLRKLVQTGDPYLASRAAYVASLIDSEHSAAVIRAAVASPYSEVRIAAASGLANLTSNLHRNNIYSVLSPLLRDPDAGVRHAALSSLLSPDTAARFTGGLQAMLQNLSRNDPVPDIKSLSQRILLQFPHPNPIPQRRGLTSHRLPKQPNPTGKSLRPARSKARLSKAQIATARLSKARIAKAQYRKGRRFRVANPTGAASLPVDEN